MNERIMQLVARTKLRISRGESWTYFLYRASVITAVISLFHISTEIAVILAIGIIVFWYILGYLDENYAKIWQAENDYGTRAVNPFFKELSAKMDKKPKRKLK